MRHPFYGEIEAAQHLVMEGGDATLSDMIGSLDRGVLISRLGAVQLLDPRTLTVSGVTRDGFFLVQKGEIVAPLVNMRFTASILELLSGVEALGGSVWTRGGVVPPIRVGGLNLHAGTQL
jgi:predicted Zn-dependent protease